MTNSETTISQNLIPNIIGNETNAMKFRDIFSLPTREGGLNIVLPGDRDKDYERFVTLSNCLSNADPIEAEQNRLPTQFKKEIR